MVAVLLLLYNPGIAYYMPKVLTEPLYLFGVLLLSWSLIEILLRPGLDRARWFVLAGIGLTITLLTRPVLQIMVIGAIVMTWLLLLLTRSSLRDWRPLLRKILVTLIAACALPAAVVIKNGMQFGIWSMGTGSGAGLYYGVNPLRLGHEPSFVGFEYDIGEVVRVAEPTTGGEPLDRTADQIERKVAISVLQNTRMQDLLAFLGLKLRSWLLYSPPELAFEARLRKFRLFEWLCIAAALIAWLLRRRPTHSSAPLRAGQLKVVVTLLGLGVTGMLMQLRMVFKTLPLALSEVRRRA